MQLRGKKKKKSSTSDTSDEFSEWYHIHEQTWFYLKPPYSYSKSHLIPSSFRRYCQLCTSPEGVVTKLQAESEEKVGEARRPAPCY